MDIHHSIMKKFCFKDAGKHGLTENVAPLLDLYKEIKEILQDEISSYMTSNLRDWNFIIYAVETKTGEFELRHETYDPRSTQWANNLITLFHTSIPDPNFVYQDYTCPYCESNSFAVHEENCTDPDGADDDFLDHKFLEEYEIEVKNIYLDEIKKMIKLPKEFADIKEATKSGNTGHVTVPKSWIGEDVLVINLERHYIANDLIEPVHFTNYDLYKMTQQEIEALRFISSILSIDDVSVSFLVNHEIIDITAKIIIPEEHEQDTDYHSDIAAQILKKIENKYPFFKTSSLEACDLWCEVEEGVTYYQWYYKIEMTEIYEEMDKEELINELSEKVDDAWDSVDFQREKTQHDDEELTVLLFNNNADWGFRLETEIIEALELTKEEIIKLAQKAHDQITEKLIEEEIEENRPEELLLAAFYDFTLTIAIEDRGDVEAAIENFFESKFFLDQPFNPSDEDLAELKIYAKENYFSI